MASFRISAGTNIGLRDNNEDNFVVCADLVADNWFVPSDSQQMITLGEKGCIMVVADGMGGENAGEVASDIAIKTVREMFSSPKMPDNILFDSNAVKAYLKKVIVEADRRVKNHAERNQDTYGMGSTIVIAWLVSDRLFVAWLGDSRAYCYRQGEGIRRLSKDHSYVQQLVDSGMITEAEAMHHPNSNIITRSLGDLSQKAKPDVAEYAVISGDIILLCSDGLCGVCDDQEIGNIIESGKTDLKQCIDRLFVSALNAGGSDNITVTLLQVVEKGNREDSQETASIYDFFLTGRNKVRDRLKAVPLKGWRWIAVFLVLAAIAICFCVFPNKTEETSMVEERVDTTDTARGDIRGVPDRPQKAVGGQKNAIGGNTTPSSGGNLKDLYDSAVRGVGNPVAKEDSTLRAQTSSSAFGDGNSVTKTTSTNQPPVLGPVL